MEMDRLNRIEDNIKRIQERIALSCDRAGRNPEEVNLVAVTKAVDPETAQLVLKAGIKDLGENRVPEAQRKIEHLGAQGTWHMIGHLQRNKVKKAIDLFSLIHSVDSIRLMKEISAGLQAKGSTMEILLEVNISGEESKYGFTPQETIEALSLAAGLPGIRTRGLMTMAPYDPDPEAARPHFRALRELEEKLQREGAAPDLNLLSMGMSGDFEPAVEEGATHVRVGTALYEGL